MSVVMRFKKVRCKASLGKGINTLVESVQFLNVCQYVRTRTERTQSTA